MTLLSEIIVVNRSPFTIPKILQWPVFEKRKRYQGKEHDISYCFRLGRKRQGGEARKERAARKQGKDSEEMMGRI